MQNLKTVWLKKKERKKCAYICVCIYIYSIYTYIRMDIHVYSTQSEGTHLTVMNLFQLTKDRWRRGWGGGGDVEKKDAGWG